MRTGHWRIAALVAAAAAALAIAPRPSSPPAPADPPSSSVARGRYLTHDVAMCVQCHSPRNESGVLVPGAEFRGAPMPVASPYPGTPWAMATPNLRGLTGFSDEQVVHLLTTGIGHRGIPPDPPMPPFRMTREDAEAVVAYLRSLS